MYRMARFFETGRGTLFNIDKIIAVTRGSTTPIVYLEEDQSFRLTVDEAKELRSLMLVVNGMPVTPNQGGQDGTQDST